MTTSSQSGRRLKMWLKARLLALRGQAVQAFLSYDAARLRSALREVGVEPGRDVMLHSGFGAHHGFRGTADQLSETFLESIGPDGHLLMVSLPYRSSTLEYLQRVKRFDVRKTPSMMGLVSEHFRRRADVWRSLHPTHPMLVHGPQAAWYVSGHEDCEAGCGAGTPFEKFAERDGLVVFFNVPLDTLTFFHHLEHLVRGDLPFALYTDPPHEVRVIDRNGQERIVRVRAYTAETLKCRRFARLEAALRARGSVVQRRIGNTTILAVRARDAVACAREMQRAGQLFYDLSGVSPASAAPPA